MANLHFHYGTMGASKSAKLIMDSYNFRNNAIGVECIKPSLDGTSYTGKITSRMGIETSAMVMPNLQDYSPQSDTRVILVDDIQFFAPDDIDALVKIADNFEIIVMCYGLMVDSNEQLFPASAHLIAVGAKLNQLESNCQIRGCMSKATHHLRLDDNDNVIHAGDQIAVGVEKYKSVCRRHFDKHYKKNLPISPIPVL